MRVPRTRVAYVHALNLDTTALTTDSLVPIGQKFGWAWSPPGREEGKEKNPVSARNRIIPTAARNINV
jgi:hypothetical protein